MLGFLFLLLSITPAFAQSSVPAQFGIFFTLQYNQERDLTLELNYEGNLSYERNFFDILLRRLGLTNPNQPTRILEAWGFQIEGGRWLLGTPYFQLSELLLSRRLFFQWKLNERELFDIAVEASIGYKENLTTLPIQGALRLPINYTYRLANDLSISLGTDWNILKVSLDDPWLTENLYPTNVNISLSYLANNVFSASQGITFDFKSQCGFVYLRSQSLYNETLSLFGHLETGFQSDNNSCHNTQLGFFTRVLIGFRIDASETRLPEFGQHYLDLTEGSEFTCIQEGVTNGIRLKLIYFRDYFVYDGGDKKLILTYINYSTYFVNDLDLEITLSLNSDSRSGSFSEKRKEVEAKYTCKVAGNN